MPKRRYYIGEVVAFGDGFIAGDDFIAGEGFTAGVPFNAGVGFIVGEAFAPGDGDAAGAGFRIGTVAEAVICHCPLRRTNVSTDRYWPLMFWAVLESAGLYLPPLTVVWSVTTAASLSKTLTTISESSHESKESAPPSMSLMS